MIYLKLFLSFVQIGLFSIGGGYVAIPLIRHQTVDIHGWLSLAQFTDLTSIAEMTPGPIAINAATFVGLKVAGFSGALIATFGCIFPSIIICSLLAFIYNRFKGANAFQSILKGLRPATIGLILSSGITILQYVVFEGKEISLSTVNIVSLIIFLCAFLALRVFKIKPIPVMLLCAAAYLLINGLLIPFIQN